MQRKQAVINYYSPVISAKSYLVSNLEQFLIWGRYYRHIINSIYSSSESVQMIRIAAAIVKVIRIVEVPFL